MLITNQQIEFTFLLLIVHSVFLKGRYVGLAVKKTSFNTHMKTVSFQSPEVLSNITDHVLP